MNESKLKSILIAKLKEFIYQKITLFFDSIGVDLPQEFLNCTQNDIRRLIEDYLRKLDWNNSVAWIKDPKNNSLKNVFGQSISLEIIDDAQRVIFNLGIAEVLRCKIQTYVAYGTKLSVYKPFF
ncbi:MAG: hypothetical protein PVH88_26955 [Ignavibacteria bacterium]|jgi:hypothetical protein